MIEHVTFTGFMTADRGRIGSLLEKSVIAMACIALCVTSPGSAGSVVRSGIPESTDSPKLKVVNGAIELSLDEAITIALERNLALNVERYVQESTRFGIQQSRGIFDLGARVSLSQSEETNPRTSNLDGAQVQTFERQGWNMGLSQLLKSGGTASINWNNSRSESNSLFATVNPSFRSDLDFSLVQPLLKGRGKQVTERGIIRAQNNLNISRENFEARVTSTIQQVDVAVICSTNTWQA